MQFNVHIHMTTLKVPTIRQVWQVIQQGGDTFSVDLKDAYLHTPIVKHHEHIFTFCLAK